MTPFFVYCYDCDMHLLLSALGQHCHRVQRIQRTDCIVICWGASGSLCSKKTYGASLTQQPAALKFLIVLMVSPRCRDGKTNELARARDCSLIYTHLQMPCLLIAALWNSPLFCNVPTFLWVCVISAAARRRRVLLAQSRLVLLLVITYVQFRPTAQLF